MLALLATAPGDPAAGQYEDIRPWPWLSTQVCDAVPHLTTMPPAILAKLRALGLAEGFPDGVIDFPPGRPRLTTFGQRCLGHLHALGDAVTDAPPRQKTTLGWRLSGSHVRASGREPPARILTERPADEER